MIHWAMHKLGVTEWLVSAVRTTYVDARTVVRTVFGNSKVLMLGLVYQGSDF